MSNMSPEQFLSAVRFSLTVHEWNADLSDHLVTLLQQAGAPLIEIPENYRIRVEVDSYYEPDGDYDLEQERAQLESGDLTPYAVLLEKQCECGSWNIKQSLSGVVVETGNADNTYDTLDEIPDNYLRWVSAELIMEEEED